VPQGQDGHPADVVPTAAVSEPLSPGVRVSLELPDAGTCVGVVDSKDDTVVVLSLLDDLVDGDLETGVTLDLFMPRPQGIYHWLCVVRSLPEEQKAELELLSTPVFVQRRLGPRVEAGLQAQVRRVHSSRRGTAHEMQVADLSRGGMKLEGPFQVRTGDTLEVSVDLGSPVQLTGRAVMAYQAGSGRFAAHVSFVDGQRDAIESIDGYIARRIRH
jgi:hypothetical protein